MEGVSGGDGELLRLSSSPDRNICVAINITLKIHVPESATSGVIFRMYEFLIVSL